MPDDPVAEGRAIAGALIAVAMLDELVKSGTFTVDQARHILQNALSAAHPFTSGARGPHVTGTIAELMRVRFPAART